jgi:hypothetical protein
MNMRHAAALALVGWYLMTPPYDPSLVVPNAPLAGQHIDTHAPLSSWDQHSAYDTAAEREKGKDKEFEKTSAFEDFQKSAPAGRFLSFAIIEGLCVGADDPRLKGK